MDNKEGAAGARNQKVPKVALVTGATSSLGREVIDLLLQEGYDVRAILQSPPKLDHGMHGLPLGVKPYVADIAIDNDSTRRTLLEASFGVNVVFHIAGVTYNQGNTYEKLVTSNVIGTENVISAFTEANKGSDLTLRFVFSSSVTVYGYNRKGESLNEDSELRPESNYSRTKMMAEEVIKSYSASNPKLKYTILRLGTIYGKGYERSFFKVLRMIQEGKARYIGSGENHLTLIGVEDAAVGIVAAAESQEGMNKVFNLTDGEPHTTRSLFNASANALGVKPPPEKGMSMLVAKVARGIAGISYDELEFLASDRVVSTERIQKAVGFSAKTSIKTGIKHVAEEFLRSHHNSTGV